MIRAIIFDCFGVVITDALQVICDEVGQTDPGKAREMTDAIALSNKGIVSPEVSGATIAAILGVSYEDYSERIRGGEAKHQSVLDYIRTLRPHYKTAMLTNVSASGLRRRFTEEDLARYFDVAVASGDIGYAKPETRAYEIVAHRLGVRPSECVMVDDREEYCAGAVAAGMRAIQYLSLAQVRQAIALLLADKTLGFVS